MIKSIRLFVAVMLMALSISSCSKDDGGSETTQDNTLNNTEWLSESIRKGNYNTTEYKIKLRFVPGSKVIYDYSHKVHYHAESPDGIHRRDVSDSSSKTYTYTLDGDRLSIQLPAEGAEPAMTMVYKVDRSAGTITHTHFGKEEVEDEPVVFKRIR